MVLDVYTKKRILFYENLGLKPLSIVRELKRDIQCRRISREGVRLFLKQYKETGSIARKPGSGRPTKITAQAKRLVDDRLREDDETTATQLHALLRSAGIDVSLATISRCREKLGWTFRGSKYCQHVRPRNKEKRLAFAKAHMNDLPDGLDNIVWTDELSIQLEKHALRSWRKKNERAKQKPK